MKTGFVEKTELAIEDIPIPYYCIVLTAEQVKLIENKQVDILRIDGRVSFAVKNADGVDTGERAIFIVFRP